MVPSRSGLENRISELLKKPVVRKRVAPFLSVVLGAALLASVLFSFVEDGPVAPDPCTRLTAEEVARFVPGAGRPTTTTTKEEKEKACEWRGAEGLLTLRLEAHEAQRRRSAPDVAGMAVQDDYHDGEEHTERRRVYLHGAGLGTWAFARTPPAGQAASYATVVFHRGGVSGSLTLKYFKPGTAGPPATVEQAQSLAVQAAQTLYARLPRDETTGS
ncbi:hypothetical protein [Actinomadura sp. SCN-SB]|uniref:hypothetical protein n=1 Tax=Actinomadura sp. SCN-SB TaxID=3373092 RepID=UPI003753D8EA